MNIEAVTQQFESVLERARAVLDRDIEKARKTIDALNAEKATAQAAVAQLADQHKQAKAELDAVIKHLGKASTLVGLDHEIKEARKTLEGLEAEISKASTAAAASKHQQSEAEALRVATWNEVSRLRTERGEHEARMADLRMKLRQVQLGSQP